MKTTLLLAALVAAALALPSETYNPQYDNFNAEEVAENTRLLQHYGLCFLDKGPCTAEGDYFKEVIPEALKTTCGKCSPKQRKLVRIMVHAFQKDLPDIWQKLAKKEDPTGKYKESFNDFLNAAD